MQQARPHHNVTLAVLGLAGLSYALQQTMVLPALPALQRQLHTTETWATLIFTAFLLTSSVLTPILGKLGDQYGKERLLAISLAIFLVGSIGAAASWNIWSLIGWRAFQGAGAAVFPLSFAIVNDEMPAEKAGAGIGAISAVMGAGGGLGLPLSGVIVDHASWRWLFVVGAVVIAAALLLVVLLVPESPIKTPSRIDFVGAALLSVLLVAFLVAMSEGERWGWGSARTVGLLATAAVLAPLWVRYERRRPEPLVDMRMLAQPTVLFANLAGLFAGFALFGSFVLVPQFVETASRYGYGLGGSATEAGLILLPGALLGFVSGPLVGVLGRRFGYRTPLALGMALATVGLAAIALFHDTTWQLLLGMSIAGIGIPASFGAMAKLVVDAVRPEETAVASGLNTVMRTIGGVVGGQALAAILTADRIAGSAVPAESAYTIAFTLGAVVALLAACCGLAAGRRGRAAVGHEAVGAVD